VTCARRIAGRTEEEEMSRRTVGLLAVALLVFCAPAALSQTEQTHPVYTYVSLFQVPRASWAQYAEETEKTVNPAFERQFADGTLIGWGNFETVVHTTDGMTPGAGGSSTSLAVITRALAAPATPR